MIDVNTAEDAAMAFFARETFHTGHPLDQGRLMRVFHLAYDEGFLGSSSDVRDCLERGFARSNSPYRHLFDEDIDKWVSASQAIYDYIYWTQHKPS